MATDKAPLCKGGWRRRRLGDCDFCEKDNPSVFLLRKNPPPLTQGRLFARRHFCANLRGRQITVPYNFRKIHTKPSLRPIYNRYLYTRARQKTVRPQEIVVEQGGLPSCPQHLVKSSIYRITVRKIGISLVKIFLKKVLTLHLTYCRIMEHACEKTGELRPFSGTQDCTICVEAGGCSRRAGYFRGVCPISNRAKK